MGQRVKALLDHVLISRLEHSMTLQRRSKQGILRRTIFLLQQIQMASNSQSSIFDTTPLNNENSWERESKALNE